MGDDREEIARIIDHEGYWERLDSCNHALATVSMTDDQRRALTAVRDDELRGTASSLAKADAILARQGPGPGEIEAAYKRGWSDCEDEFLGRATEILPPGSVVSPGPGEAVAWRVKDFADGWTLYADKDAADVASLASSGALVEALGVIAATPTREA